MIERIELCSSPEVHWLDFYPHLLRLKRKIGKIITDMYDLWTEVVRD